MKTGLRVMAILAIACCIQGATSASAAEHRENRWFMGADMGGGSAGFKVGSQSADREIGGVFGLRGGYGFKPDLTAGLELTGWIGNVGDVNWDFYVSGPSLTWYPGDRDFFVRGTFGLGDISATSLEGEARDTGVGALASVGQALRQVLAGDLQDRGTGRSLPA